VNPLKKTLTQLHYTGTELETFAMATNWKKYVARQMKPYIHGRVLEVGAGIGSNTAFLLRPDLRHWLCLEPDPGLLSQLKNTISNKEIYSICTAKQGIIDDLTKDELFDTIIYYDVLEHIEHDRQELLKASQHLGPGGHLIILAPAHQSMFSAFDKAIGHYRRYNKKSIQNIIPTELYKISLQYLDSCGFLAYKAFGTFTKKPNVSAGNVQIWDKILVPFSRILDPLLGHGLGKSILAIYKKRNSQNSSNQK